MQINFFFFIAVRIKNSIISFAVVSVVRYYPIVHWQNDTMCIFHFHILPSVIFTSSFPPLILSFFLSFFLSFPFQIIQLFRTGSERTGNQRALVPKLKTLVSNTSDLFGVCGRGRQTSVYVLGPTAATQGRAADQKQIERSSNHFAVLCNC